MKNTKIAAQTAIPTWTARERALYRLYNQDSLEWLNGCDPNSIQAVITDPPYGLLEYTPQQLEKLKNGSGGVWRIPPAYDGHQRKPLPRFTVLRNEDLSRLYQFFNDFAQRLFPVTVPGAHIFLASNPLVAHIVTRAITDAGYEIRGTIVRLVTTLRGGDRPKNAHIEFPDITVMPRSCWEPWLLFRKPCEGTVSQNLRKWNTGGLRRISTTEPFKDVITSPPARGLEREIAPHPSLKPQQFLRPLACASLPFGEGTILDPFMGSGSTIAAATACELKSIGVEINTEFYKMAVDSIPKLSALAYPKMECTDDQCQIL